MTLAVVALLVAPLLRKGDGPTGPAAAAHDVEVYRDQLNEVVADEERGLIGAGEAAAARLEIERRLLRAAERASAAAQPVGRGGRTGLIVAGLIVPLVGFGLYANLGTPGLPDQPFASRAGEATAAAATDAKQSAALGELANKLAAKLAEKPDDAEGWTLLGRTYMETGRFAEGAAAYGRAAALSPVDADLKVSEGEALVYAAEGAVTPAARAAMETALKLDPHHPGALFYLGLGIYQSGDKRGAYEAWVKLGRDTPPEAPYLGQIQSRVDAVARELGITPAKFPTAPPPSAPPPAAPVQAPPPVASGAPGPSAADVQAAQQMAPDDRNAMIRSMVQRLADKLAANPADVEGWTRLGRAYGVLGEAKKSAEAWGKAAALAPADPAIKAELAKARAAAGLP